MKKLQLSSVSKSIAAGRPMGSQELSKEQRHAIGYFFVRIKAIDPLQYDTLMPDEKTEAVVKREYAPQLASFTTDQIDKGIQALHKERQAFNPEYKFINFDKVIGLIKNGGNVGGVRAGLYSDMYDRSAPRLPEPEHQRRKRKEMGRKACSSILDILND